MRMFFAVTLEEGIKTALLAGQEALDSWCDRAKFTEKNNLHLTIKFIGEVAQRDIPSLEEAAMAAAIRTRPFPLTLQEVGAFFRGREAVLWAGVAKEPGLMALYRHLQFALEQQGFPQDRANYTPHIPFARQARLKVGIETVKKEVSLAQEPMMVRALTLMESRREGAHLIYRPVFVQPLQEKL